MAEKRKRIWDNYRNIGAVQKSDRIKIVVGIGCRDGVRYINIREFYYHRMKEEWCPSRDGITIPLRVPISKGEKVIEPFPNMLGVLLQAVEELNSMPLEDENNQVWLVRRYKNEKEN